MAEDDVSEGVAVDGPESALSDGPDRGRPLVPVQQRQLPEEAGVPVAVHQLEHLPSARLLQHFVNTCSEEQKMTLSIIWWRNRSENVQLWDLFSQFRRTKNDVIIDLLEK